MGCTLVTGGAGFIGSAVVRQLLARGRRVRVLVEPGGDRRALDGLAVEIVEGSVLDRGVVTHAMADCDVLYHLAAIYKLWMPDATHLWDVNVEGTTQVMLCARRAGVRRIVYTSSTVAIGLSEGDRASDEAVAFNHFKIAGDYILSKHVSERVVHRFVEDGLPVVIVNPGLPFGERDFGPTPSGKLMITILRREVPALGPGGISVIDVDACARGHVLAEERGRVGERYILTDHNLSGVDFVRTIGSVAGVGVPRIHAPAAVGQAVAWAWEWWADHVSHVEPPATLKALRYAHQNAFFSPEKARHELGLESVPLEDTIARAVAFFRREKMV
jgi:dihydroflavonol-4-reductase